MVSLAFAAENNEIQKEVQGYVNNFQMNSQWISSVPCVFFSVIAGALSDEFGRKPLLLFPLIGDLTRTLLNIVNYAFIETLPLEFFYLDSIASFFGGSTVYYLGVYSYGTTVTKPNERAHRLARLDGIETLANIVGTLLSPFIFKQLGYFGNYAISSLFFAMSIAYLIWFVREPIQRRPDDSKMSEVKTQKQTSKSLPEMVLECFGKLKSFLAKAVIIPLIGMKSVVTKDRKSILKFLIFLQFLCYGLYLFTLQMQSLTYLYMLLVFDGFNETDYALFNIVMSLISFVCLMIIMPIFSGKFQVHDALMLFIISVCEVASAAILPFTDSLWQFYLGFGLGTMGYCKYAVVRSLLSKCIDTDEVGKVFSILAVIASVAPVGGNPVFRQLYNKTLSTFPGAVFLLYAALLSLAGFVNLFLYFMRRKIKTGNEVEEETGSGSDEDKAGNKDEKERNNNNEEGSEATQVLQL